MQGTGTHRNTALDVMRGMTLMLMIIVNTPGSDVSNYAQLDHALWHGFTLTDLVFPSFLFVVGGAIFETAPRMGVLSEAQFWKKVATRAALIFLFGYLQYWFPFFSPKFEWMPFATTRFPGVLQRIALCYLCVAVMVRHLRVPTLWAIGAAALLGYWGVMMWWGDLSMAGNLERAIDLRLIGAAHMYHGEGMAFDPEGLLSTVPAMVNALSGYLVFYYLARRPQAVPALVLTGVLAVAVAVIWNSGFPINKKLWTSSFVLCTVGLDMLILAALVQIIDIWQLRRWTTFFEIFGKNTLFIYLLSGALVIVLARIRVDGVSLYAWLFNHLFHPWLPPADASLGFALCYMLCCWLVAYWMDCRRLYIKL